MRIHVIPALILLILVSALQSTTSYARAQPAEPASKPCNIAHHKLIDLLDPEHPADEKRLVVDELEVGVAAGCAYHGYVLGTLLRHGPSLPGNVVEQDPPRAQTLIETYARGGHVSAYADLAEMALARSDARDAMKWTQVYLHFMTQAVDSKHPDFDRRGYNANLLMRAEAAWRKARLKRREIKPLFNEYLSAHRETVLAGLRAKPSQQAPDRFHTDSGDSSSLVAKPFAKSITRKLSIEPGYANFLLEVQPDGRVSRIVAETFGPSAETPAALRPLIEGVAFEPFKGSKPRVIRVPVVYGYVYSGPALKD